MYLKTFFAVVLLVASAMKWHTLALILEIAHGIWILWEWIGIWLKNRNHIHLNPGPLVFAS